MKIAVDVNVSNRDIGELCRDGDQVVCVAMRSEEDSSWVERALDRDCDVFISQDLDIPNLLDSWRVANDVLWFETVGQYTEWRRKNAKSI